MRHRISGRKLNRKTSHRMALLKNLAKSLIINEQIETTLPKAKDLRPFVEKIVHSGKNNNLHSRRKVFSFLRDNLLVNKVLTSLLKGMLTEMVDILEFSDPVLDMVTLLRRQLLNWLIEMYQQKGMLIKKELKNKKNKKMNKKYLKIML